MGERKEVKKPQGWNKKYLSAEDRKQLVIVAALMIKCEEYIKSWEEIGRPRIMITTLKMIRSYCDRLIKMVLSSLADDERIRVCKEMDQYKIFAAYSQESQEAMKKLKALDSNLVVYKDDLFNLMEEVLEVKCKGCKEAGYLLCGVYQIYRKYDLPIVDEEPKGCPFQGF